MRPGEEIISEVQRCAALFRFGREVEAALSMVELFEGVQATLVRAPADVQQAWAHLLLMMFEAQEREDWLGLADTLQYELIEVLQAVQCDR